MQITPYEFSERFRVNYVVFWFLISSFVFALQELFLYVWRESGFFTLRLIFTYLLYWFVPVSVVILSRKAKTMIEQSQVYFVFITEKNFHQWLDNSITYIVSYKSVYSKIGSIAVIIAFDIVILLTPNLRFDSLALSLIILMLFHVGGIMGGHATYLVIVLLVFLDKLTKYDVKAPFYTSSIVAISPISNFYYFASTTALFLYLIHDIALLSETSIRTNSVVIWLILGSFFPLALFLWIFFCSHLLMQNVKRYNMKLINIQIQSAYKALTSKHTKGNVDILKGLIDIQNEIERSRTWAFDLNSMVTFFTTAALPVGQIIISNFGIF